MNEPTPKCYKAENVNQIIKSKGLRFSFDPYQYLGGTWQGVYRTSNPNEQDALAAAMKENRSLVEIIEAEYDLLFKKKSSLSQSSGILTLPQAVAPVDRSPLIPQVAPPVGEPVPSEFTTPPSTEPKPLETATDALNLGPVSAQSAAEPQPAAAGCDLS